MNEARGTSGFFSVAPFPSDVYFATQNEDYNSELLALELLTNPPSSNSASTGGHEGGQPRKTKFRCLSIASAGETCFALLASPLVGSLHAVDVCLPQVSFNY